jgi:hypothetical protein
MNIQQVARVCMGVVLVSTTLWAQKYEINPKFESIMYKRYITEIARNDERIDRGLHEYHALSQKYAKRMQDPKFIHVGRILKHARENFYEAKAILENYIVQPYKTYYISKKDRELHDEVSESILLDEKKRGAYYQLYYYDLFNIMIVLDLEANSVTTINVSSLARSDLHEGMPKILISEIIYIVGRKVADK